jgi:hypothetical protein
MVEMLLGDRTVEVPASGTGENVKLNRMVELYKGYIKLQQLAESTARIVPRLKNELAECMIDIWNDEQKQIPKGTCVEDILAICEDPALVKMVRDGIAARR